MKYMRYALVFILIGMPVMANESNCRSHLSDLICAVDSPKAEKDRYRVDRLCDKSVDTRRFLSQVQSAYDVYPPVVQKQLCSLSKIYLEKEFFGNAWSDTGIVAINKNFSDADPDMGNALSGFDQLSFGGKKPGYEPSLPSPIFKVNPSMSAVTHTLLHELAHTLDYSYQIQERGWAKLSKSKFPLQKRICLNSCQGKFLSASEIPELYLELQEHGYVSQLAATSPMEDFAETFAFVIEHDSMRCRQTIEPGKKEYDILSSEAVSKKIAYVRKFFEWLNSGATGSF